MRFKIWFKPFLSSIAILIELLFLCYIVFIFLQKGTQEFLPSLDKIEQIKQRPYIKILDKNGDLLSDYGDFYAQNVQIQQMPDYLIHALLDTEDKRFFKHIGFDIYGVFRAALSNLNAGKINQGGSSITQQLAKNFLIMNDVFGTFDQSVQRKVYELFLAFAIEKKYSKNQILQFYINRVYFGSGSFGIAAGAKRFFNKQVEELNVYESARLVGMIQAPSRYAARPDQARIRTIQVIENMIKSNHILQEEKEIALMLATETNKRMPDLIQYFTDWIVQNLNNFIKTRFPNTNIQLKNITVHTTLDPLWQEIAQEEVLKIFNGVGKLWEIESIGFVACDKQGAIRAFIGGADYQLSQFNGVSALRQAGSLFKVILYLAALEYGLDPTDIIEDEPIQIGNWIPQNFTRAFKGDITVEDAFAQSINTVSVKIGMLIGVRKIINMARKLGIKSHLEPNLSICLGSSEVYLLDMIKPFLILLNGGCRTETFAIEKIICDEKVAYDRQEMQRDRVLDLDVVSKMNALLIRCATIGTARKAQYGVVVGGKTGTTQNHKDQWMVGMSGKVVVGLRGGTNKIGMNYQPNAPFHVDLWREFMSKLNARLAGADNDLQLYTAPECTEQDDTHAAAEQDDTHAATEQDDTHAATEQDDTHLAAEQHKVNE